MWEVSACIHRKSIPREVEGLSMRFRSFSGVKKCFEWRSKHTNHGKDWGMDMNK